MSRFAFTYATAGALPLTAQLQRARSSFAAACTRVGSPLRNGPDEDDETNEDEGPDASALVPS
ncbi:hypothetical protein GCM10009804_03330 [Kribbella hippodromi]|uniref:Uncharacterized protein n=1 Tax=Kribbella hippodromi TaxID=434347 RepID=A0ABN2C2B1_9ACTN